MSEQSIEYADVLSYMIRDNSPEGAVVMLLNDWFEECHEQWLYEDLNPAGIVTHDDLMDLYEGLHRHEEG